MAACGADASSGTIRVRDIAREAKPYGDRPTEPHRTEEADIDNRLRERDKTWTFFSQYFSEPIQLGVLAAIV